MTSDMNALNLESSGQLIDELKGKYLTFWTDGQMFGIPISDVVQIVGIQKITAIPEFPYYAKGIINLRGTVIPVVDVRLRLGKAESEYTDRTCIIVTSIRDGYYGFIVDSVNEVTAIDDEQISPPPQMGGAVSSQFLTGVAVINGRTVLAVDSAKLVGADDLRAFL